MNSGALAVVIWRMIDRRRLSAGRIALTVAIFLLYAVAFVFLYPKMGSGVSALVGIPVLIGSWLLGLAGGVLCAVVSILLNASLLAVHGEAGLNLMLGGGGTAGSLMALALGIGVGYARTLHDRYLDEIAARREAEAALRSSEAHFRTLFEESPLGISFVEREDRFVHVNARLCEMLGYSEEELKARTYVEITHPEDVEANAALTRRLNAGEIARFDLEKRYVRKDGTSIWVNLTVSTIPDEDGQIQGYVGMVQDIGERRRNEQALQRRDRMLEALAFSAEQLLRNPSWDEALETVLARLGEAADASRARILENGAGGEKQLGARYRAEWTAEGIASTIESARHVWNEEAKSQFDPLLSQLAQGKMVYGRRESFPQPLQVALAEQGVQNSALIPVFVGDEWWGQLGFDDCSGHFSHSGMEQEVFTIAGGLVGAAIRRQQMESRLRQRNRELQLLNRVIAAAASSRPDPRAVLETACRELAQAFDATQAGAALLDESGAMMEVVAEYMTGETPSALGERIPVAGNLAAEAVLREKRPLAFDDVQQDPRLAPIHDLMRRRGVASMIVLPIQVNGDAVGTIGLDTVTQRNFTEDEMQLAMTAMTAVGQVLERARLYEAAEAQERLAAVGQLSAGIAHDFNNILGVIVIYAEMLQQLSLPAPAMQRIDVIYQQAQRASQLVQQILDFSRKTVMRRQTIELQAFLQEQAELLRRTLPETIEIDVECEEGVSYQVAGDATRLQQAVMNLAVNAQGAMPDGGRLQFALSRLGPDATPRTLEMGAEFVRSEDWILLEVSDCGSGIEAKHLGHIFEPFYTTKAPGEGSGLGLAQVYGIVKQHQGHIDVTSEVGQGTTFEIYLPALQEAPESVEPTEEGSGTEAEGTVLVVEDNEIIREALSEILKTFGYEVFEAEDGQEAIGLFKAHREEIGLVVSDMVMPRAGGRALYQALRAHDPDVRMIFTSGYPLDEENKRFVEESGSVWVNKPFSHETLAKAIARVFGD